MVFDFRTRRPPVMCAVDEAGCLNKAVSPNFITTPLYSDPTASMCGVVPVPLMWNISTKNALCLVNHGHAT